MVDCTETPSRVVERFNMLSNIEKQAVLDFFAIALTSLQALPF